MKQDIPDTVVPDRKLSELSKDEITSELAKFQEALKSDAFKDVDIYKTLGLEAPKPEATKEDKVSQINQETIDRLLPAYVKVREELTNAKYDFTEKDSKMSAAEKDIHERIEKQNVAKFAEQKADVTKIDPDFPTQVIENLNISTDDKVAVMIGVKEIVSKNSEAVKKVQDELTKVTSELQEVKLSAPVKEAEEKASGESIVTDALAKFGVKDVTKESDKGDTE